MVFQKNLEMINAAGKRLHDCEKQRQQAKDPHAVAIAASALAAEKATHQTACVDLRKLATKLGNEYQQNMENALAASRRGNIKADTPRTLHIKSGQPVNMFEAQAWSAAFVEFLYGDCAPNLARPRKVGMRELFHYLALTTSDGQIWGVDCLNAN